jgi:hypothetical protein
MFTHGFAVLSHARIMDLAAKQPFIPWFVNLSRGSGIRLEQLVGWPYPVKEGSMVILPNWLFAELNAIAPSFSAVGQRCRRSTVEMTSDTMCLTILSHVLKDGILHLIGRGSASRDGRSREGLHRDIRQVAQRDGPSASNSTPGCAWRGQ